MVGQTISHFEILEKLGEGGMGVVWRARDLRLDRFVALKVLPPEKVANLERKRRFIQEAKTASALNHPYIVTIYEIDQADGIDFIVMEFVRGKTLDQLIPRKGLRMNEALKYAIQITDALAAAHATGIVHRDLKPGNVMVSENGSVKVLDFGLAKLTEKGAITESEGTQTMADTDEGTIVGTFSYMSPEQAEGKKVDARSDIFSFGALLYEMLTGRRAFHGDSKLSTLAAVLHQEPKAVGETVADVPRDLEKLIARCLRKDPARRLQHMDDIKVSLEELREESDSGTLPGAPVALPKRKTRRLAWVGALVILATVAGAAGWRYLHYTTDQSPPMRVTPLTTYRGSEVEPSFSPDGNQVAFSWNGENESSYHIYVKLVNAGQPLRLTTAEANDHYPAWSPDGLQIAFVRSGSGIFLISPLGGPERKLTEVIPNYLGRPAWMPDGKSLAASFPESPEKPQAIYRVDIATRERHQLTYPPEPSFGDAGPSISPDGKNLAFIRLPVSTSGDLYIQPLGATPAGDARRLTRDNQGLSGVAWTPDGREVVFASARGGSMALWRIGLSAGAQPERVAGAGGNATSPAISRVRSGTSARLAYQQQVRNFNIWRAPGGHAWRPDDPAPLIVSSQRETSPQYSPDGGKIAFVSSRSGNNEIWTCNADGQNCAQLTFLGVSAGAPRWSPDSHFIVFNAIPGGKRNIYVMPAEGGQPRQLTSEVDAQKPSWSRDGRWIYFCSTRSGSKQIWRMPPAPGSGNPEQVTKNGGSDAFESPDGKLLYYTNSSGLWSLPPGSSGPESSVIPGVLPGRWAVSQKGIYFVTRTEPGRPASISFFPFDTHQVQQIGTAGKPLDVSSAFPFTASMDGRWVVWSQLDHTDADLMMLENFR